MKRRKHEPQFARGQMVTVGQFGQVLMVIDTEAGSVTCVDLKTGLQGTYSAHQIYKI
jgi:hypothetical protein